MDLPVNPVEVAKAYKYKAELLLKDYMLADSYVLYAAVHGGILMCKLVLYLLTLTSSVTYYYPSSCASTCCYICMCRR
jgi:hypothetical protein